VLEEIIWLLECGFCKRLIFLLFPGFMSHLWIDSFTGMKTLPNIIHKAICRVLVYIQWTVLW